MSGYPQRPSKRPSRDPNQPRKYSSGGPTGYKNSDAEDDPEEENVLPSGYDNDKSRRRQEGYNDPKSSASELKSKGIAAPPRNDSQQTKQQSYSSKQSYSEPPFSDRDPLRGLRSVSKTFLDTNTESPSSLKKSADFLSRNQDLLVLEDLSEWRERARIAVRGGKPEVARQLLQLAQLIRLFDTNNRRYYEDLIRLERPPLQWFIEKTYNRYSHYIEEAEDDGLLLESQREYMLEPWAKSVKQGLGYDILARPPEDEEPRIPQAPTYDEELDEYGRLGYGAAREAMPQSKSHNTSLPIRSREKVSAYDKEPTTSSLPYSTLKSGSRVTETGRERPSIDYSGNPRVQTTAAPTRLKEVSPLERAPKTTKQPPFQPLKKSSTKDSREEQDDIFDIEDEEDEPLKKPKQNTNYATVKGTLDPKTEPRKPSTTAVQRLSSLMREFISIPERNYRARYVFCSKPENSDIWREDLDLLPGAAFECLRNDREVYARQIIECYMLLTDAKEHGEASKHRIAWMKRLYMSDGMQDDLKHECKLYLRSLKEKSAALDDAKERERQRDRELADRIPSSSTRGVERKR